MCVKVPSKPGPAGRMGGGDKFLLYWPKVGHNLGQNSPYPEFLLWPDGHVPNWHATSQIEKGAN